MNRNIHINVLFFLILLLGSQALTAELPEIKVRSVRRLFDNGEHNAFTDLVRFRGEIYLTFRSCPDGHMVHPTSSIIIMKSSDGQEWRQMHSFAVEKRDVRDPHFLVFRDRLFVYTGTWYCGEKSPEREEYDVNKHLGFAVWTTDGEQWSDPVMLEGTYGHYIWRAATFGGKAYLCGRRKHLFAEEPTDREILESAMLESENGLVWKTRALFQEHMGDETAFLFKQDGSVIGVSRRGRGPAELVRSRPPFKDWERKDLDRYIGGPLLVKWNGLYLVGGRKVVDGVPSTCLYWLDNGRLVQAAQLPSGGDNSYPGFVQTAPSRALLSYYSSHEKDNEGKVITAIYLAELELVE